MPQAALPDALRAQIARSKVALALATSEASEMPLCLVNDAFCQLTGYDPFEIQGRNCRFLQTPDTPREQIRAMSDFLHDDGRDDGRFPVINQTRQGRIFTNLVFMSKLRDAAGCVRFVIGSQFDLHDTRGSARQISNDLELTESAANLRQVSAQFGLTMADSTALMARSVSTLARLTVRHE